jgi:hypothetical protein
VSENPYEKDLFAATDFSGEPAAEPRVDASAALDFSAESDSVDEHSVFDETPVFAPAEPAEDEDPLVLIDSATHAVEEEEPDVVPLFTVTNPPGTVSVSALGDGAIERVALTEDVAGMTEAQLAEEILVVAQLAGQKGQAAQHQFLMENLRELGADDPDAIRELLENGMALASPEQAAEAQAEVFTTRYPRK